MSILAAEEAARKVAEKVATSICEKTTTQLANKIDKDLDNINGRVTFLQWIGLGTMLYWGYKAVCHACFGPAKKYDYLYYDPLYIRKYY